MRSGLLALAFVAAACSSDSSNSGGAGGGAGSTSGACGGRAETYFAGISKDGTEGRYKFTLTTADPAPPQLFDNTWRVKVESGGQPLDNAELSVKTWMPDHQHGSPKRTDIVEMSGGEYELKPVNLFMPGFWEIHITAARDNQEDDAIFKFCIGE